MACHWMVNRFFAHFEEFHQVPLNDIFIDNFPPIHWISSQWMNTLNAKFQGFNICNTISIYSSIIFTNFIRQFVSKQFNKEWKIERKFFYTQSRCLENLLSKEIRKEKFRFVNKRAWIWEMMFTWKPFKRISTCWLHRERNNLIENICTWKIKDQLTFYTAYWTE